MDGCAPSPRETIHRSACLASWESLSGARRPEFCRVFAELTPEGFSRPRAPTAAASSCPRRVAAEESCGLVLGKRAIRGFAVPRATWHHRVGADEGGTIPFIRRYVTMFP